MTTADNLETERYATVLSEYDQQLAEQLAQVLNDILPTQDKESTSAISS